MTLPKELFVLPSRTVPTMLGRTLIALAAILAVIAIAASSTITGVVAIGVFLFGAAAL